MDAGKYEEAISAFEELDEYKDSTAKIIACENAIIQHYENKYNLSDYIEVQLKNFGIIYQPIRDKK